MSTCNINISTLDCNTLQLLTGQHAGYYVEKNSVQIVDTIADLPNAEGSCAQIAFVPDKLRGGFFVYTEETDLTILVNEGTSFNASMPPLVPPPVIPPGSNRTSDYMWIRLVESNFPLNPHWWGAVGDGTTDDTTAIQSMFDNMNDNFLDQNNYYFRFPTGYTFLTTSEINISLDTSNDKPNELIIEGYGSSINPILDLAQYCLDIRTVSDDAELVYKGLDIVFGGEEIGEFGIQVLDYTRILIQDAEITKSSKSIRIRDSSNILLSNCYISGPGDIGIHLAYSENITIDSCREHTRAIGDNHNYAVYIKECENVAIRNSVFEGNYFPRKAILFNTASHSTDISLFSVNGLHIEYTKIDVLEDYNRIVQLDDWNGGIVNLVSIYNQAHDAVIIDNSNTDLGEGCEIIRLISFCHAAPGIMFKTNNNIVSPTDPNAGDGSVKKYWMMEDCANGTYDPTWANWVGGIHPDERTPLLSGLPNSPYIAAREN